MTDLAARFHDAPLDRLLTDTLAAQGLAGTRVDAAERAQTDRWIDAVARGFLDGEPNEVRRTAFFERAMHRRLVGVYDDAAPHADVPVATFGSWTTELTVPGGVLPASAISSVTVAPTHRRRGILSTVMTGELRTAAELGLPVAVLTVSESTIYGRFGFAPAASAAAWELTVHRARWIGPDAPGRIDFLTREEARDVAVALHERTRLTSPGEIALPAGHADRFLRTGPAADKPEQLRAVQYRSPSGEVQGVAAYRVAENEAEFGDSTLELSLLLAVTDEAYAGLWRFFLSMDLIGTIRASELAVDEPLWWMIADQRAAKITVRDHQYVRILDVPAALAARSYDVADTIALEVTDPLEIAGGTFVLTTDASGSGSADPVADAPVGIPLVRLGIAELSALLLGGVSAVTLARAGRIAADEPERLARLFQTSAAPRLSYWY